MRYEFATFVRYGFATFALLYGVLAWTLDNPAVYAVISGLFFIAFAGHETAYRCRRKREKLAQARKRLRELKNEPPLQKSEPLPLVTASPVTGTNAVLTPAEVASFAESLRTHRLYSTLVSSLPVPVQEKEPEYVPAGQEDLSAVGDYGDPAEAEPVPDNLSTYVPAGQEDLSAALLEYVRDQVNGGVAENGRRRTRAMRWEMNAEWLDEVRKLKNHAGAPLWIPRVRAEKWQTAGTLFYYPVMTGEQYGVPELKSLLSW